MPPKPEPGPRPIPSQGVIYTTHYREAAPGQAGWPTGQPPADKIYGPIKDDFRFSHSGQVWYTFIDGNVPTPGFTLYHLPSEAAKLQQLYNGQLGDPGCNSGDGSIVCHWEPLHSGYNSPSSNPNDTVNCRRIGGTLYCDGTIYYQRLSYKITFHRNITDGFPPVFDVTNIKYQQDISNVIADNAAALDLSTKVESGKTYIFEGWYDNPGFDGNPYSFSGQTMPHSDLILYAKWVLTPVRVNYCRSANELLLVTHKEINDNTVEGLRHKNYPAFTVQFHPDAAPGPHDGVHLFDEFMDLMDAWTAKEEN